MSGSTSAALRWAVTAGAVILMVLIVLQLGSAKRPASDPAQLVRNDSAAALLVTTAGPATSAPAAAPAASAAPQIAVDVIGAVQQPGVYWLGATARIVDVVQAAGGLAPDADRDRLNMAAAVVDGQQIRVPRVGESVAPSGPSDGGGETTGGTTTASTMIDLNRALHPITSNPT